MRHPYGGCISRGAAQQESPPRQWREARSGKSESASPDDTRRFHTSPPVSAPPWKSGPLVSWGNPFLGLRLGRLRKNSRFVSGHRFSDAVSGLLRIAPLGAEAWFLTFSSTSWTTTVDCQPRSGERRGCNEAHRASRGLRVQQTQAPKETSRNSHVARKVGRECFFEPRSGVRKEAHGASHG